jgi:hypothetical protein
MKKMQNLHYVGSFSTLQTQGNSNYLPVKSGYSPRQNELYNRLLYGIKAYTPEEWYALNSNIKNKVIRRYKKAQTLLNIYKQERLNDLTQPFLGLFKNIKDYPKETDSKFFCTLSFKDLGIDKKDIVSLFISNKMLPPNFDSL